MELNLSQISFLYKNILDRMPLDQKMLQINGNSSCTGYLSGGYHLRSVFTIVVVSWPCL